MNYKFHPLAVEELNKAITYYEEKSHGLGFEFYQEVSSTIQWILQFPKTGTTELIVNAS